MAHGEAKGSGRTRARTVTKRDHDVLRHHELGEKTLLPAVWSSAIASIVDLGFLGPMVLNQLR